MQDIAIQLALTAGVLLTVFSGPLVALWILLWRKRRLRVQRRSPISRGLLRSPGHTLNEQLEEANRDAEGDLAILMVMPLMLLTLYLAQVHVLGTGKAAPAVIYGVATLGIVVRTVRKLWKTYERIDHLKAGLDAEVAVGQELDQLMRQGAAVFHDFPGENFNIDHVVIARQGVFAVETKGYSKLNEYGGRTGATVSFDGQALRFPGWTSTEPLGQADRQAQWLARWLASAVAAPIPVVPVLALPGWFVERTGRGSVRVFNGRELAGLLRARGTRTLSDEEVQRVAHQVEQRCRTVKPKYLAKPEDDPPK